VIGSAFPDSTFKRDQKIMKPLLFICFLILFGWLGSGSKPSPSVSSDKKQTPDLRINDTIDFAKQIQPIMIKNCSPCHFTGGKMYERLPFDKDTTIINHEAGILRRIKGEENSVLNAFIQQQKR
jgi:hypothetical protein